MTRRSPNTLLQIFQVPLIVAALSLAGLVLALLGDGAWDVAGVLLLAAAPVAAAWGRWRSGVSRSPAPALAKAEPPHRAHTAAGRA